jgi:hypothetical protein
VEKSITVTFGSPPAVSTLVRSRARSQAVKSVTARKKKSRRRHRLMSNPLAPHQKMASTLVGVGPPPHAWMLACQAKARKQQPASLSRPKPASRDYRSQNRSNSERCRYMGEEQCFATRARYCRENFCMPGLRHQARRITPRAIRLRSTALPGWAERTRTRKRSCLSALRGHTRRLHGCSLARSEAAER